MLSLRSLATMTTDASMTSDVPVAPNLPHDARRNPKKLACWSRLIKHGNHPPLTAMQAIKAPASRVTPDTA